eukprot:COSAG06_NODE_31185_length_525_cov_2.500000_1_plen_63_part_10
MPHSGRRGASQLTRRGVSVLRLAQQVGIRGRARVLSPPGGRPVWAAAGLLLRHRHHRYSVVPI